MPPVSDIAAIARDAVWLPHRYDPGYDAVHFRRTARAEHRAATFVTDEHLKGEGERVIVRRAEAMAAMGTPAPIHFIFHSAYCCSTLLARAVDRGGVSMGLKEPVILNDLVGWKRRGADPRQLAAVLDNALALLARPFTPGEASVIKPSNIVNALAPAILAMRPQARAILLYAPLRTFLGSIAKKGMWGRLWVRELFVGQLQDRIVDLGFEDAQYLGQTDLQIAAAGWLVQHALFARLADKHPARVRTLDSETLVARPAEVMAALSDLFALKLDDAAVQDIVAGPAFTRHSKFDADFGGEARAAEHADAAAVHADEIEKVAVWAEAVAKAAGIGQTLSRPLVL